MFDLRRLEPDEATDTVAYLSRVEMGTEIWTTKGGDELPFGMEYENGVWLLQYPRTTDPVVHAQDVGGETAVFLKRGKRGVQLWGKYGQPVPAAQPTVMAWQRDRQGNLVFNLMQKGGEPGGCGRLLAWLAPAAMLGFIILVVVALVAAAMWVNSEYLPHYLVGQSLVIILTP